MGYYAVDLDGTLAHYDSWRGIEHIGEPIPAMVERVKEWRRQGQEVKIFTARMSGHGLDDLKGSKADCLTPIQKWCEKHLGEVLPVTNVKDFGLIELYDDRCVQVKVNTGELVTESAAVESQLIDFNNLKENSVIVFKIQDFTPDTLKMIEGIATRYGQQIRAKNCSLIVMRGNDSLETLDEKEMNQAGWYKKGKIITNF